jgi:hypothetical protein
VKWIRQTSLQTKGSCCLNRTLFLRQPGNGNKKVQVWVFHTLLS